MPAGYQQHCVISLVLMKKSETLFEILAFNLLFTQIIYASQA